MYCFKCGEENPDEAKFCKNCGALLKEEEKAKKVEIIEQPNTHQNTYQKTTTTSSSNSKSDSSNWMGCCLCIVVIFIIFSILGMLGL